MIDIAAPRAVELWRGKTPDAAIPPRVRLRLYLRAQGVCANCKRKLGPGDRWDVDHVRALINGGLHAEENLQVLCSWCHGEKSRVDVATKAKTARVQSSHIGLRKPKGRPMPGSRASGWKRKMNGTLERR